MAEQKKVEGEEKKSSKKKLIIIIVAAVVLLAGLGGGGYYYFFMRGHDAEEAKEGNKKGHKDKKKNKKDQHEKKSESDGGDEEHPAAEELYHDLGKPLVVTFSKSSSVKFVQVSLSFLVEGAETVEALKKNDPMIRNNLLMLINAQDVEVLKTREGKEKLRAAILADVSGVLEKMAGKGHVKEIFFTSFVMQ